MPIESVMPSSHLILSSPSPPAPKPSYASGSFPMNQLFTWGGQSIGVSASASVLPVNTQDWSPLGWTGWISLQSKGLSRVLSNTSSKASIFQHSAFFTVQLSHPYRTTGKTIVLTRWTFVGRVMSLLFNMLSRLVITFMQIRDLIFLHLSLGLENQMSRKFPTLDYNMQMPALIKYFIPSLSVISTFGLYKYFQKSLELKVFPIFI